MAGLLIQEEYFSKDKEHGGVRALFEPLEVIFAPVFFVVMGMQVDLSTLSSLSTIGLALALSLSAIVGKVICGLAGGAKMDRLSIGIGMVPRGEVGLIFASIGKTLGVVSEGVFSAVILMVMLTTVLTPLGLSWSVARWEKR